MLIGRALKRPRTPSDLIKWRKCCHEVDVGERAEKLDIVPCTCIRSLITSKGHFAAVVRARAMINTAAYLTRLVQFSSLLARVSRNISYVVHWTHASGDCISRGVSPRKKTRFPSFEIPRATDHIEFLISGASGLSFAAVAVGAIDDAAADWRVVVVVAAVDLSEMLNFWEEMNCWRTRMVMMGCQIAPVIIVVTIDANPAEHNAFRRRSEGGRRCGGVLLIAICFSFICGVVWTTGHERGVSGAKGVALGGETTYCELCGDIMGHLATWEVGCSGDPASDCSGSWTLGSVPPEWRIGSILFGYKMIQYQSTYVLIQQSQMVIGVLGDLKNGQKGMERKSGRSRRQST